MNSKGIITGICVADLILLAASAALYMRQDRTVPVISFSPNDIVYEQGMDESLLMEGVSAVDDRDGDVSGTLLIEKIANTTKGDVIVTYAAMDSANNVGKASRVFQKAAQEAEEKAGQDAAEEENPGDGEENGDLGDGAGDPEADTQNGEGNPGSDAGDGDENPDANAGDGEQNPAGEENGDNPAGGNNPAAGE